MNYNDNLSNTHINLSTMIITLIISGPLTHHSLKIVTICNSLVPLWAGYVVKHQLSTNSEAWDLVEFMGNFGRKFLRCCFDWKETFSSVE